MTNSQIASQLRYAALLLEYLEGPSFPVRRFAEMADTVEDFDFPIRFFGDPASLRKIHLLFFPKAHPEQIGTLRALIEETPAPADPDYTQKTGLDYHSSIPLITALEKAAAPETAELIRLPEMGPARAAALRDLLGIKKNEELLDACKHHQIRKLEGFSADLEKRWSLGKWYSSERPKEFPPQSRISAEPLVSFLLEQLELFTGEYTKSPVLTPWDQFRRADDHFEPDRRPSGGQFRSGPWDAPIIPMSNVQPRRSFAERVRGFFIGKNSEEPASRPFPPAYTRRENPEPQRADTSEPVPLLLSAEPVGDFRRLEEAVKSFDFLLTTSDSETLFDRIETEFKFINITDRSRDELDAYIEPGKLVMSGDRKLPGAKFRFFIAPPHSRAAQSVFLSSAPDHWAELTRRAETAGYQLDKFGLFRGKDEIQLNGDADLYKALDLPPLPPETRNGLFEFGLAPELLIRREQMRGDLHLHSTYTDGTGTIEQMVDKALSNGLQYIAMTDHSKRVAVANGMNEERILAYWNDIDDLNRRIQETRIPFRVLKGVEVDVLGTAVLDFSDEILSHADWVMASLHFEQGQPRDQIHRRLTAAFRSPYVSAISHPTGKTWQSSFRIDMDYDFLFDMAKKYNKCLEMNSQPRRFDLDWHLCREAKERGVKIVISTDSHAPEEMDYLAYGIQLARKAGLTADDIINTRPVEEILALRNRSAE